ncbi:MAG: methionine adenosyltransferase domain-containing protein [Sphaerochaetaceae bacterium]|nr:methionine adenosyltransferase domain-containing protein [Sphaerochaetaceae bacterium]
MLKTAECVTPKHPDKICDQISDAILDACLKQDKDSRVAIETMGGHNLITITGELTTKAYVNIPDIVREIVGEKYGIQTNIVKQSPEISQGVDTGGAGDQGIMVGYACRENEDMIPMELYLARDLAKLIYNTYSKDGKTQITINENGEIVCVVASFCDAPSDILKDFISLWLYQKNTIEKVDVFCNPAGDWSQGGFDADTGLTGRKLAVDNYGPQIPIGGGSFSGKDASKVDRSGAYMARKIAVDYLKKFSDASEVIVKLAYSIGIAEPVMATALVKKLDKWFEIEVKGYELTPKGIIKFLKLKNPIYQKTAEWGHMGNGFIWDN